MYNVVQKFITKNRPYSPLSPVGIVIHETANPDASAELHYEYFGKRDVGASAHAFIDEDSILQLIPWNEISWHAGKTANRMYWGVEMCHTNDPVKFNEIWKRAVWLCMHLLTQVSNPVTYKVNNRTLRSHREVADEWKETDHQDPHSYFEKFGVNVDMFRSAVQNAVNTGKIQDLIEGGLIRMVLKKGDTNQCVVTLQTQLKKLGYDIVVDGSFGAQTEAAVKDFQSMMELDADGVVGDLTYKKLGECVIALKREVESENNSTLEITPPVPKVQEVPNWKKDGAKFLYEFELTDEEHNPIEQVDIGTLGVILKKFYELVK